MRKELFITGAALALILVLAGALSRTALAEVDASITHFPIPTNGAYPSYLALGPDGNVWFTEYDANKIGRIMPNGQVTEFGPTAERPWNITAGPDGNLWYTAYVGNAVGKITTNGDITEYTLPTDCGDPSGCLPEGITPGLDGNLWVSEQNDRIAKVTPMGAMTEYTHGLTVNSDLALITTGADGKLWFVESQANQIGKISLNGTITEYPIPTANSYPFAIAAGPDGKIWFTEYGVDRIGRITRNGVVTEFYAGSNTGPGDGIAPGADGNLWFTGYDGNELGRSTPAGSIVEFLVATHKIGLEGLTVGPRGDIWFAEGDANRIGRKTLCKGNLGPAHLLAPSGARLDLNRVVLLWVGGLCADSFNVIVRQDSTLGPVVYRETGIKNFIARTTKLERGHTYFWRVMACNAVDCVPSPFSKFRLIQ